MIKAIETRYKGYRFRSRLEARWAVFFDALGLRWEYEPEGFELPSGRYLPDFFIHWDAEKDDRLRQFDRVGYWIEIKGNNPTEDELEKLRELTAATKDNAYLFAGEVARARVYSTSLLKDGSVGLSDWTRYGDEEWQREFNCHTAAPFVCARKLGWPTEREFARAFTAARSARFEHGECGAPV